MGDVVPLLHAFGVNNILELGASHYWNEFGTIGMCIAYHVERHAGALLVSFEYTNGTALAMDLHEAYATLNRYASKKFA